MNDDGHDLEIVGLRLKNPAPYERELYVSRRGCLWVITHLGDLWCHDFRWHPDVGVRDDAFVKLAHWREAELPDALTGARASLKSKVEVQ